jgi:Tfp pilus assembly protein PilV
MNNTRRGQRGMSLVEALVAFAISSVGLVALVGTQSALRQNGDAVRQRAEAVRLAQGELERLRSFASAQAHAELAALPSTASVALPSNTQFMLERALAPQPDAAYTTAAVKVHWTDRQGQPANVTLHSVIAAIDPVLSGRLSMPAASPARSGPMGRAASIPIQSTDLGDGRSVFVPPGASGFAWVFSHTTGHVTDICTIPPGSTQAGIAAKDLTQCTTTHALILSGQVRFATEASVTAADAERPGSDALALELQLILRDTDGGTATCIDNDSAASRQASVSFHCLVQVPASSAGWSGRLDVLPIGWTIGTDAGSYRVCRYSADQDGRNGVSNDEHPLDYTAVGGTLAHQNFLVIRGTNACPADVAADPSRGDMVNSNTVEHAPRATPTPAA